MCVENTFSQPVSGTLDTATGVSTLNFQLQSRTVLTGNPTTPCPTCRLSVGGALCAGTLTSPCVGVCDGSPNQGAVCTSRNATGVTADCPSPAALAGASKCYRGANNGAACSTGADCPNGGCALFIGDIAISLNPLTTASATLSSATGQFCLGQGTGQKGAFRTDICSKGANSGLPCATNADCPTSLCRAGTLNNYCVGGANDGKGCVVASDCTGGICLKAGTQVQFIRETGSPAGALAIGVPTPINLGSAFCVGATSNPTVNANANLPGPGATAVVGNITLLP